MKCTPSSWHDLGRRRRCFGRRGSTRIPSRLCGGRGRRYSGSLCISFVLFCFVLLLLVRLGECLVRRRGPGCCAEEVVCVAGEHLGVDVGVHIYICFDKAY
jgi:hypothetical protein